MLCSVCHKNMAIIFTKKVDGDKSEMEGLCYNCAKEKGINPLEIFAKQANIPQEDLNNISKQFENIFDDVMIDNINELDVDGASENGIPLGSIFSNMFKENENDSDAQSQTNSSKKVKTEKKPKEKRKAF